LVSKLPVREGKENGGRYFQTFKVSKIYLSPKCGFSKSYQGILL
jgi:hypothetical protein